MFGSSRAHGFSTELINELVAEASSIFSVSDILKFIVLFTINCTNQIKSNYLNSHGEEAQEKPPGL